ncbi:MULTISPECIES: restriction endonuclease subunit S [unclassified Ectothiorhodospira]|uniref:restriction endonuclease subunit S n=1 Tax=unclassified Ectothiorhodospira TaxID=2684909 RepID=UPI001EE99EC5|nr:MULTISPECIES: restriction endonuclease subunit S [unclassified Ectothiorhodospira]MCG5515667.1 restriction endonuclease subunit S [Ectothiorhodospira sp. 9100]MCG5518549.1 restriction endonuclease subunit S [Ectothiorhodospira sp. 9905]
MNTQELITAHLDLWTGAVTHKSTAGRGRNGKIELTGIKKLRELVLELAVRGKLVDQDPSEEPASVLLERIAEERARLVKEGKIKKPKKLPEIAEEDKPFELPDGWEWARMEAISEYIQRGKGPKYANSGKVRIVSQKCVQWSSFDLNASRFVDDSSLSSYQDERYIRNNDILWNSTGTGTVGRVIIVENPRYPMVADSHVTIIRLLATEPSHILNYISSPSVQQRIEPDHENSLVSGTTKQVELNSGSVKLLAVPLPPLEEQQRIVEKVDELMALCDRLEQKAGDQLEAHEVLVDTLLDALTRSADAEELSRSWARVAEHFDTLFTTEASIDKLKQTILQLAVMGRLVEQDPNDESASVLLEKIAEEKSRLVNEGKIKKEKKRLEINQADAGFDIPKNWAWVNLGELGVFVNGDRSKNYPNREDYVASGIAWINTGHIRPDGTLTRKGMHFITREKFDSLRGGKIEPTDLVYCLRGATFGKTAFVTPYEEGAIASSLMIIRPLLPIMRKYIYSYLVSPLGRSQIFRFDNGSAQPNLSANSVMMYLVPLPPANEQRRIVEKVDELMVLCNELKARLAKAGETRTHLAEAMVDQAVN